MLSECMFHESTINALKFYGQRDGQDVNWLQTAKFLEVGCQWWNIVNVKSTSLGRRKRDDSRLPIYEENDESLQFLEQFLDWLIRWKNTEGLKRGSKCLTRETTLAIEQTTGAFPKLVKYLLDQKGLEYVLLGKLQSDPIERRFGQYRQMAGGNFYVSVRQVCESEKNLRVRYLVKYSGFNMDELKEIFQNCTEPEFQNTSDCVSSLSALFSPSWDEKIM